ncbi:MAG TPA: hypothetical protein VII66_05455, partial [Gemmatimonadaceae bacterium]|jgi:protein-tyrosine phosphatase
MARQRGLNVTFASAGTGAPLGAPANDAAILVGIERGVDLSRHRSRPLLPAAITGDTIILAMAPGHIPGVRAIEPNSRVFLLDEYSSSGATARAVADPYGGDLGDYRDAADRIEEMLVGVLDRLTTESARGAH